MVNQINTHIVTEQEKERYNLLVSVISETLNTGDLLSYTQKLEAYQGRAILCWLLHKYEFFGKMHMQKIAGLIGRDYKTVGNHIVKHEGWYFISKEYRESYHLVGAAYSRALQQSEMLQVVEQNMQCINQLKSAI